MLRRTGRQRKPRTVWEQKGAPSAASDPKVPKKAARTVKKTALKPIAVGPLPEKIGLNADQLPGLPSYEPPLDLQYQPSKSLLFGQSELQCFQALLTPAIIDTIVAATNSYAENFQKKNLIPNPHTRSWKPVNSTDIWRCIGCLLYMGVHIETRHENHWTETGYLK